MDRNQRRLTLLTAQRRSYIEDGGRILWGWVVLQGGRAARSHLLCLNLPPESAAERFDHRHNRRPSLPDKLRFQSHTILGSTVTSGGLIPQQAAHPTPITIPTPNRCAPRQGRLPSRAGFASWFGWSVLYCCADKDDECRYARPGS